MHVIDITWDNDGVVDLMEVMEAINELKKADQLISVRVGIDPLDSGLKFSVNWSTWSPPIKGEILA